MNLDNLEEWMKGYIAGVIDGEGTIRLNYIRKRDLYYPEVIITNSDVDMLIAIQLMLDHKGTIGSQLSTQYGTDWKGRPIKQRKPIRRIYISNRKDVKDLLEQIKDYLVTKTEQAQLVLEFIEIRDNLDTRRGSLFGERSDREAVIFSRMEVLNER